MRFGQQITCRGVEKEAGGKSEKDCQCSRGRQDRQREQAAKDRRQRIDYEKDQIATPRTLTMGYQQDGIKSVARVVRDHGQGYEQSCLPVYE